MIKINCDVGEGMDNEKSLFKYITSCSIACGGHAGDEYSMRTILKLAKEMQVLPGAHPSYPDKENFGRESMDIAREDLIADIRKQISQLNSIAEEIGMPLNHIKAHGALYNDAANSRSISEIFLEAIEPYKILKVYVPYGSELANYALEQGFSVIYEAFADRNYSSDLKLIPRSDRKALISDPKEVLKHVQSMNEGMINTLDGQIIEIKADTFCVHSDTENALKIVKFLRRSFKLKFKPYGDQGTLIEWPQEMNKRNLYEILNYTERLKDEAITNFIQSPASILVLGNQDEEKLRFLWLEFIENLKKTYYQFTIPVCYDSSFAPDMELLSNRSKLSKKEIIKLHSQNKYSIYSIGFLPGFMYLGDLDERLHIERKSEPRLKIPKGSVGIGGMQTGIYPQESPGGWQLIGQTPIDLFDPELDPPCFAKAGDEIIFEPISLEEFKTIKQQVLFGHYKVKKEVIHD